MITSKQNVKGEIDKHKKKYERDLIVVNAIISLVKISGNRRVALEIKRIAQNAKDRLSKGDPPLLGNDKQKLRDALGFLKEDAATRIISSIEKGDILFMELLHREIEKVELMELEKLTKLTKLV